MDLAGLQEFWEEGREATRRGQITLRPFEILPLMGRFKAEDGERNHLLMMLFVGA